MAAACNIREKAKSLLSHRGQSSHDLKHDRNPGPVIVEAAGVGHDVPVGANDDGPVRGAVVELAGEDTEDVRALLVYGALDKRENIVDRMDMALLCKAVGVKLIDPL